jgi:ABC-type polysaccharide/polyol phosphate export permease
VPERIAILEIDLGRAACAKRPLPARLFDKEFVVLRSAALSPPISTELKRQKWIGEPTFVVRELVAKDFKVRYRNMSLGVFWSLLNPLVMMGVLWFVFTRILNNHSIPAFGAFVLCGIVPYNFFTLAWASATSSLVENANLVKRVAVPPQFVPIASVLSIGVHLVIQICLLLAAVLVAGRMPNPYWLLLPLVWGLEVLFVCGLGLMFAAINVYVRDIRYVVESFNTVLFWLVPIFYDFTAIPQRYRELYQYNPVAALVLACRSILLHGEPPPLSLMLKLSGSSLLVFFAGFMLFRVLRRRFYDYL